LLRKPASPIAAAEGKAMEAKDTSKIQDETRTTSSSRAQRMSRWRQRLARRKGSRVRTRWLQRRLLPPGIYLLFGTLDDAIVSYCVAMTLRRPWQRMKKRRGGGGEGGSTGLGCNTE